jgi:hypothetical protein
MFFTVEEKTTIHDRINACSTNDQVHIFYILKSNEEKYSYNNNGIFFDLIETSNKTIEQIKTFLDSKKFN